MPYLTQLTPRLHLKQKAMRIIIIQFIYVISLISNIKASSNTKPHPHQGKAKSFQPGNPNITLDENAIKVLQLEQPYQVKLLYSSIK